MARGRTSHRAGATRRATDSLNGGQVTGGGENDAVILQDLELQDDHQAIWHERLVTKLLENKEGGGE